MTSRIPTCSSGQPNPAAPTPAGTCPPGQPGSSAPPVRPSPAARTSAGTCPPGQPESSAPPGRPAPAARRTCPPGQPCRLALLGLALLACEEVPRTYSSAGPAQLLFADRFDGAELAPAWNPTGPGAKVTGGELVVEDLRNHPVWLTLALPEAVRIEFDARAETDEGDIKVELAGDGRSYARTASYVSSGYVVIFGGWSNSLNAIARRDEHGGDRKTSAAPKVEAGKRYHFAITRRDGAVRWELDGQEILAYDDPDPLTGPSHTHFAFGGWEARVAFDNLEIYAL